MDNAALEVYYEKTILPMYSGAVTFSHVVWKDHGKVGPDAWAHYFDDNNGREYVLIYEDFPGRDYLNDDLTHEIVHAGDQTSLHIAGKSGELTENVSGYFTLFAEREAK